MPEFESPGAAVHPDNVLQLRQIKLHFADDLQLGIIGDHHGGSAVLEPIGQGVRAEQDGKRQGDGADLVAGQMGQGSFHALGEDDGHTVLWIDPEFDQGIGQTVGQEFNLAESIHDLVPGLIFTVKGRSVGLCRVPVADLFGDVDHFRYVPLE